MEKKTKQKYIKETILKEIGDQLYVVGDMLPKQIDIAERFGVSRATVHTVINELIYDGVLKSVRGKGTFVQKDSHYLNDKGHRLDGFSESFYETDYAVETKYYNLTKKLAEPFICEKLKIPKDNYVVYIQRVRILDGVRTILENSYMPYEIVKDAGLFDNLSDNTSLYSLLRDKIGLEVMHANETMDAVLSDKSISELLQVDIDTPIIRIERTTYSEGELPFEFCINYAVTGKYRVGLQMGKTK